MPPDRKRIFWRRFGVLIFSRWMKRSAVSLSALPLMNRPARSEWRRQLMLMFSATDAIAMIPSSLRSSGHSTMPWRIASPVRFTSMRAPSSVSTPARRRSAPYTSRISSLRPAPTSPKKPTISPARTEKLAGSRNAGPSMPSAENRTSPSARGA
ncbi:hypothetical protein TQ36_00995 [Burkholderia cenocepacia]|nr:hypothetical protein TQ36_00995 [Burkholderia cenocepacia]